MRSISQWLADTFSTRSQVRLKITSRGRHFAVSTTPGYTFLDSLCVGNRWVKKASNLEPTLRQYKEALQGLRHDPGVAPHNALMQVMPDVVAYVRTLGDGASVRAERQFVVYL